MFDECEVGLLVLLSLLSFADKKITHKDDNTHHSFLELTIHLIFKSNLFLFSRFLINFFFVNLFQTSYQFSLRQFLSKLYISKSFIINTLSMRIIF